MGFDWMGAVREGALDYQWVTIVSEIKGWRLELRVMRDAIKVHGIRQPATARDMQQVADVLGLLLPTPKVLDLVWRQAGIRFDAIVNIKGRIVANCSINSYNEAVEEAIRGAEQAQDGPIACVGKYWVICNSLDRKGLKYGRETAANYGWHSSRAPSSRPGVTGGDVRVWQTIGTSHNYVHVDPSQVVRLVDPICRLSPTALARHDALFPFKKEGFTEVDFRRIAQDENLWGLVNHDGPLRVLRQPSVEPSQATVDDDGVVHMPETTIIGQAPDGEEHE